MAYPGGSAASIKPILTENLFAPGGGSRHFVKNPSSPAAARAKAFIMAASPFGTLGTGLGSSAKAIPESNDIKRSNAAIRAADLAPSFAASAALGRRYMTFRRLALNTQESLPNPALASSFYASRRPAPRCSPELRRLCRYLVFVFCLPTSFGGYRPRFEMAHKSGRSRP